MKQLLKDEKKARSRDEMSANVKAEKRTDLEAEGDARAEERS